MDMAQLLAQSLGLTNGKGTGLKEADPASFPASCSSDPLMAAFVSLMLKKNSDESEEPTQQIQYERRLARAQRVIQKLNDDIATAEMKIQYIAKTFGSCPACWGQNRLCSTCKGNGKPGCSAPMEEELLAWAEPALIKMGMRLVKSGDKHGMDETGTGKDWDPRTLWVK